MDNNSKDIKYSGNAGDVVPPLHKASGGAKNTAGKGKGFVSAGERIHKWSTYLGIDWIFNAFTGVSFAYWAKYSDVGKRYWSEPITKAFIKGLSPFVKGSDQLQNVGKKYWSEPITKAFTRGLSLFIKDSVQLQKSVELINDKVQLKKTAGFIKDEVQLKESAGYGNIFMSIIAGGMFTLPPLLMLENKKVKKSIVMFYDRLIYGKKKVENDPKFQKAYDEIDNAPKKDFWSGLLTRFVALAPLLAIVLIPSTKKLSNKLWFDHVEKASGFVATKAGFSPEKSFKELSFSEAKDRWKFIHESVAMDFGLGIPYAILHSFFYNMFTSRKGKADNNISKNEQVGQVVNASKAVETGHKTEKSVPEQRKSYVEREASRETIGQEHGVVL